ncbi:hypothetical protein AVEN_110622-1 [Araneus ventricosus]|uniref:Uncharacterized protein n=1 Tax=Araneus ventricosus TaxID=182803 RepID=A0A4Y2AWN8_ARAVE|nr:hypothetical protein AVEN_110622-1 [Araneus ventricosus]
MLEVPSLLTANSGSVANAKLPDYKQCIRGAPSHRYAPSLAMSPEEKHHVIAPTREVRTCLHTRQLLIPIFEVPPVVLSGLQHEGYLGTDLVILNRGQMSRTTPELAPPLQPFASHQLEDVWPLRMIWRATGPIHGGSSVESGFEQATLRFRGRDLTTRPTLPKQGKKKE